MFQVLGDPLLGTVGAGARVDVAKVVRLSPIVLGHSTEGFERVRVVAIAFAPSGFKRDDCEGGRHLPHHLGERGGLRTVDQKVLGHGIRCSDEDAVKRP